MRTKIISAQAAIFYYSSLNFEKKWHTSCYMVLVNRRTRGEIMDLQKIILGQYMLLNQEPTLKSISSDTGIQITRVFRLFNGAKMKLSEYQVFQQRVREKMGLSDTLEAIALDCSLKLSPQAIKEIEVFLKRKIDLWKIKQTALDKTKSANQLTA